MHINKLISNNFKAFIVTKMKSLKSRRVKLLSFSFYIILLDQISKYLVLSILGFERSKNIIPNLLNFTLVKNKGAAFSLFSNSTNILTILSILTSLLLVTIILKFPLKSFWNSIGLAYLLGGTLGNGIDRLFRGHVLDFLDVFPINFPIFNIADISINIAILCFIVDIIKTKRGSKIIY